MRPMTTTHKIYMYINVMPAHVIIRGVSNRLLGL